MIEETKLREQALPDGRERILHEARALFLERGYQETSMQDIADAAGMTKAALYYHFRDKTDLVSTMLRQEEDRLRDGMQVFCDADDLRAAFEGTATYLFHSMTGDLPRLIMDVYKQLPRAEVQKLDMQRTVFDDSCLSGLLVSAAKEGVANSAIDPDLALNLFFGMIFTQIRMARLQDGLPASPEELGRIITTIFLDGMLQRAGD